MKKIILLMLIALCGKAGFAQKGLLSFNEAGRYMYYQEQTVNGVGGDSLYIRAAEALKAAYPKIKIGKQSVAGKSLEGTGMAMLYYTKSLVSRASGEINFVLHIEFKDAKYRFWITDIVFKPYQKDRYGVLAPIPGVQYALEKAKDKLNENELSSYLDQIGTYGKLMGEQLHKRMLVKVAKAMDKEPTKVISTKKSW